MKDAEIKMRVDERLKQEFNDIFPNMSEKLSWLMQRSIEEEKDKHLADMAEFFRTTGEDLGRLEAVINGFNQKSEEIKGFNHAAEGSGISAISTVTIAAVKKQQEKGFGNINEKVYGLVYKNLISGLYAGKEKDTVFQRIERVYRNKGNIIEYVQSKMYGGE